MTSSPTSLSKLESLELGARPNGETFNRGVKHRVPDVASSRIAMLNDESAFILCLNTPDAGKARCVTKGHQSTETVECVY
jgi:hypothetical protein